MSEPVLQVKGLKTYYYTEEGVVPAVDGLDFEVEPGETFAIVGESGCGKSVTSLSILRLIPSPPGKIIDGEIIYHGQDLVKKSEREMRSIRGNDISMIFQEPMTSLNPVFTVGQQIGESFRFHQQMGKAEMLKKSIEMLRLVGIPEPEHVINDYPNQLSGGMRQRVMIAMALACNPKILIADEPTTALDVTIQAQIMRLLKQLQEKMGTSIILITHDLGIVAQIAKHVMVMYCGQAVEYSDVRSNKMQDIRGSRVSMIFQDALSSLNPVLTICDQISEPLRIHQHLSKKAAREKALEMLRLVGIPAPEKRLDQYPHELSGGMRQRVMIAIALACRPHLLIADEPTTALDVTIQAQIMELIVRLNEQLNMGVMLITHDLAVVAQTCSRVIVMYLGQIVEEADVLTLFDHPCHPYTEGLMRSIPRMEGDRTKPLYMIPGTVPLLSQIPTGCRFAPRCAYATERCRQETPQLTPVSDKQSVRCFRAAELAQKEATAQ